MRNKRDLWILGTTSLSITIVLFVAIGVGTRHQQVKKLEADVFHGRNEKVWQLVLTTDVLDHEPNLNALLLAAVLHCDSATVQTLINKGVKVNSRTANTEKKAGGTPTDLPALDWAVMLRRADMVEVLLRNDADVNLKTDGRTAIDHLKEVPLIIRGKRVGTDAQIAHLLREAQHKATIHQ